MSFSAEFVETFPSLVSISPTFSTPPRPNRSHAHAASMVPKNEADQDLPARPARPFTTVKELGEAMRGSHVSYTLSSAVGSKPFATFQHVGV